MVPPCEDNCKKGSKFCHHHTRFVDNEKYRLEHGPGGSKDKRAKWIDQMKEKSFAVGEVERLEQKKASISKWKGHDDQIQNAQFVEDRGSRAQSESGDFKEPWEKEEFIIEKTAKKGWSREKATNRWNELCATTSAEDRDFKGDDGGERFWLPREFKSTSNVKYEDVKAQESTDVLKKASIEERDALRRFVHVRGNQLHSKDMFIVWTFLSRILMVGIVWTFRSKISMVGWVSNKDWVGFQYRRPMA
jgi:hypothetical protein